jgi:hypothetical protein
LADVIRFSLSNDLGIHVAIGGKFAELYVAYELWKHKPKLGQQRLEVKEVKNPKSCDIVLEATKKKLEVKWSVLHHNDQFTKECDNKPFCGWGFSTGKQFLEKKFDFCILLAAEENKAYPKHIFVIKCEEMTIDTMGGLRTSALYNKGSFFIEYSHEKDFYSSRKWGYPISEHSSKERSSKEKPKPSPLEEDLFNNPEKYKERWKELREKGMLS